MTKIGLLGDVHATTAPVREALSIFEGEGVDCILCPGDIAGYGNELDATVTLLQASGCKAVLGNHDLWYLEKKGESANPTNAFLKTLPYTFEETVAGKKLYMVHASPPQSVMDGMKLLDQFGQLIPVSTENWAKRLEDIEYDILIVGHTHQVFAEQVGKALVINPGSTLFNHTCAILTLPGMNFQLYPLSGQSPQLVWNWGKNQINTAG